MLHKVLKPQSVHPIRQTDFKIIFCLFTEPQMPTESFIIDKNSNSRPDWHFAGC